MVEREAFSVKAEWRRPSLAGWTLSNLLFDAARYGDGDKANANRTDWYSLPVPGMPTLTNDCESGQLTVKGAKREVIRSGNEKVDRRRWHCTKFCHGAQATLAGDGAGEA